ncbi:hypothetical protein IQ230_07775 [Gloeocapsopsis crepidinum LEGE 06123]|uniref:KGK family protein n=1 Tax=Gloeocapsopsis crepidinum LEGE 06123 TaxID=588587 RepID=A0ABR9UQD4_9CHRO|nr:KGK domain-containing protein [Gloeocapsopsis crepidinum]MBE9190258.1 hypothetical protein [Gloeocapsopsis crepidinum LEGE 06123]
MSLSEDDVIYIDKTYLAWYEHPMFKLSQLKTQIKLLLRKYIGYHSEEKEKKWFEDGVDCEILKVGAKNWQKGKIKLTVKLDFIPEEIETEEISTNRIAQQNLAETSLEDIRQKINQVN